MLRGRGGLALSSYLETTNSSVIRNVVCTQYLARPTSSATHTQIPLIEAFI